jgi:hypothetical protein
MSHATKHARHEQSRKEHRREQAAHAREAAKRPREHLAMWFLGVGLAALLALVFASAVVR